MHNIEKLYSYQEAAEILGVSVATLRRKVSEKSITHYKVGRGVRFSEEHMRQMIKEVPAISVGNATN